MGYEVSVDEARYRVIRDYGFSHEQALFLAGADPAQVYGQPPDSGGSGAAGSPVVRAFPFAFDSAGIGNGHNLYTPTVGDILLNAWIEIDTAWDGTTPTADIEQWALAANGNGGLFNGASNGAGGIDMTVPDGTDFADPTSLLIGETPNHLLAAEALGNATLALAVSGAALTLANMDNGFRYVPAKFQSASPVGVIVNQTGKKAGASSASTQGAAVLYLVTATPVTS